MENRVTVRIAGQTYTMLADESKDYMREVAMLAQQTIAKCGGSESLATTRSLALAAINLSDLYLKAKQAAEMAEERCRLLEAENNALRSMPTHPLPVSYTIPTTPVSSANTTSGVAFGTAADPAPGTVSPSLSNTANAANIANIASNTASRPSTPADTASRPSASASPSSGAAAGKA